MVWQQWHRAKALIIFPVLRDNTALQANNCHYHDTGHTQGVTYCTSDELVDGILVFLLDVAESLNIISSLDDLRGCPGPQECLKKTLWVMVLLHVAISIIEEVGRDLGQAALPFLDLLLALFAASNPLGIVHRVSVVSHLSQPCRKRPRLQDGAHTRRPLMTLINHYRYWWWWCHNKLSLKWKYGCLWSSQSLNVHMGEGSSRQGEALLNSADISNPVPRQGHSHSWEKRFPRKERDQNIDWQKVPTFCLLTASFNISFNNMLSSDHISRQLNHLENDELGVSGLAWEKILQPFQIPNFEACTYDVGVYLTEGVAGQGWRIFMILWRPKLQSSHIAPFPGFPCHPGLEGCETEGHYMSNWPLRMIRDSELEVRSFGKWRVITIKIIKC